MSFTSFLSFIVNVLYHCRFNRPPNRQFALFNWLFIAPRYSKLEISSSCSSLIFLLTPKELLLWMQHFPGAGLRERLGTDLSKLCCACAPSSATAPRLIHGLSMAYPWFIHCCQQEHPSARIRYQKPQGGFRWAIRKNFPMERVLRHWNCPGRFGVTIQGIPACGTRCSELRTGWALGTEWTWWSWRSFPS